VTRLQRIRAVWRRVGAALFVLMPIAMYLTFRPWGVPADVLQAHGGVDVGVEDEAIVFSPERPSVSALLLLPGCPVDPVAYAPLARRIAEQGHRAVIVRIPYRCAPTVAHEAALDRRIRQITPGCLPATRAAGRTPRGSRPARPRTSPRTC
jgi:hypothetical protein